MRAAFSSSPRSGSGILRNRTPLSLAISGDGEEPSQERRASVSGCAVLAYSPIMVETVSQAVVLPFLVVLPYRMKKHSSEISPLKQ